MYVSMMLMNVMEFIMNAMKSIMNAMESIINAMKYNMNFFCMITVEPILTQIHHEEKLVR